MDAKSCQDKGQDQGQIQAQCQSQGQGQSQRKGQDNNKARKSLMGFDIIKINLVLPPNSFTLNFFGGSKRFWNIDRFL